MNCPDCGQPISQFELRELFGQEYMDELEKLAQSQLLSLNPNMVNCSCGNIMEVVPGPVDNKIKDDLGQLISQESAVHMSKFRVRCGNCEKNFCCKC